MSSPQILGMNSALKQNQIGNKPKEENGVPNAWKDSFEICKIVFLIIKRERDRERETGRQTDID